MKCPNPKTIRAKPNVYDIQTNIVPCGQCVICMKNKVTEWKIRFQEEAKNSIANCFLTFTYSDEHLPKNGVEVEHLKKFNNNLKHYYKFKYYLISEYGPKTHRPHYHGLYFGVDAYTEGFNAKINQLWAKGFITITPLNPRRINYVSEYHITKSTAPEGANKNFNVISNGLGKSYIQKEANFHKSADNLYYRSKNFKLALPRYYKEKLYSKAVLHKKHEEIKQEFDQKELERARSDPQFYQKQYWNKKAYMDQILKRRAEKGKL